MRFSVNPKTSRQNHQDQVTALPAGARVIGASDFCANAMIAYGDRALTLQPHPEFTGAFLTDLLAARGDLLSAAVLEGARARLGAPLTSARYAEIFTAFFLKDRSALAAIATIPAQA